ncbi:hypothetical protein AC249_AIPGENE22771 [Exaiptasia diaphana]|nr:hypothetical protein AC249_AIPGENE22771 [Exaiptasia diaphana]
MCAGTLREVHGSISSIVITYGMYHQFLSRYCFWCERRFLSLHAQRSSRFDALKAQLPFKMVQVQHLQLLFKAPSNVPCIINGQ